jgi:hypothetical protein
VAHRGRRNADDALALALARGATLRDAAAEVGVGERTATRRWADADFRRIVLRYRADMAGRAVGELADGMSAAARTLRALLDCESPAIQLGAARSLLEISMKAREALDLEERTRALEDRASKSEPSR